MVGGATENPLTKSVVDYIPTPEEERQGLSHEQAAAIREKNGGKFNELDVQTISLCQMALLQFTGTMPYMLEICIIIALSVGDYKDMGIILLMLCANAGLGFKEQLEAAHALAELTQKMESRINTVRDGVAEMLLTRELVPGDVCMLAGGVQVPADIEWIDGDTLSVDTAALTGEPIPRKYGQFNAKSSLILCGTTVVAGEAYGIVRKIGEETEAGAGQAEIAKDKAEVSISVFEKRVLLVLQAVVFSSIIVVLIILFVQGVARKQFDSSAGVKRALLSCLSIIVASIPIALPIVMQVTMALGAGKMASDHNAVVTSVPALQDISSMSVLCSDKTGTLTTAKITIAADMIWTPPGFTKQDIALYAYMASNPDKKEDPIDRSVINHFKAVWGDKGENELKNYKKVRSVGFNPIYKRTVFEWTHPQMGTIIIGKGLPTKVMDTKDGGEDDHEDQWVVDKIDALLPEVKKVDYDLSKAGYKTLGVSMKVGNKPWVFVGILPQMDPPRVDTEITINALRDAGIKVKMITGDHLNIAKETSRKIGLGTDKTKTRVPNIMAGTMIREKSGTQECINMIVASDGFAQVLPSDKREVVETLVNQGIVVGMTGDGVNDAPALSRAQCGIAVDDATDAAKNASAIILTSEGLSAIYSGVVESRRIFRKLKAYVTYRFAASIQIVLVLATLIFASDCSINPLFIILLALFNDITMLPIAYDYQEASKAPEDPDVGKILTMSTILGLCETLLSLTFAYTAGFTHLFREDYHFKKCAPPTSSVHVQSAIFLQMFISAELLIFSTRAPTFFWKSFAPSLSLVLGVLLGLLIITVLVVYVETFGTLPWMDVLYIYVYCVAGFIAVDAVKVWLLQFQGGLVETLPNEDIIGNELKRQGLTECAEDRGIEGGMALKSALDDTRTSIQSNRMTMWSIKNNPNLKGMSMDEARQSIVDAKMRNSSSSGTSTSRSRARSSIQMDFKNGDMKEATISTARPIHMDGKNLDRPSLLGQSIKPHTPARIIN